MIQTLQGAVLLAGCLSLGACATVTRGASTDWTVATQPAGARVELSNGRACDPTPCSIRLSRKSFFTATITKPGYKPVKMQVSPELSSGGEIALLGNLVIGGLIGVTVDALSGAVNDLTPNDRNLRLERDWSDLAQDGPWAPLPAPVSTDTMAGLPTVQDADASARSNGAVDSRVVAIKVLADNKIQEQREPAQ